MKIEVIGFVEAVERLADRVGYRLTYEGGGSSVQRDRGTRSRLLEANRQGRRVLRRPAAHPGGGAGHAVPHHPRLRRGRGDHLRLRVRPGRLGHPDQAPAGRRLLGRRADQGRAGQGGPPRPDRPVPPPAALADPRPAAATWSASARGGCSTTTASRPSTSTPPTPPSTTRRRCCSGSTWPSGRSPSAGRSWSSRATPT